MSGRRNESIWPDRVSNPGPLVLELDALPIALRGPALLNVNNIFCNMGLLKQTRKNAELILIVNYFYFSLKMQENEFHEKCKKNTFNRWDMRICLFKLF